MVASCTACGTELVYNNESEEWECQRCGCRWARSQIEVQLPDGKHRRREKDDYPTPTPIAEWAVKRAMQLKASMVSIPATLSVLEPGCGDRAPFARAAAIYGRGPGPDIRAFGIDIRTREELPNDAEPVEDHCEEELQRTISIYRGKDFLHGSTIHSLFDKWALADYLSGGFDVIATNPPFNRGEEFVRQSLIFLNGTGVAVFLLRLSFMSTQGRIPLFRDRPPAEVHVLHKRPSFINGKTDNSEYGLFLWLGDDLDGFLKAQGRREARLAWLDNREW